MNSRVNVFLHKSEQLLLQGSCDGINWVTLNETNMEGPVHIFGSEFMEYTRIIILPTLKIKKPRAKKRKRLK